jgi:C_GCAxxG_C_C family probable redox protein
MWEAYGMENEDVLWASIALRGGIAGRQQGSCGALSSAAVCLGLRHARSSTDVKQAEQARDTVYRKAGELADAFIDKFGAAACIDLIGVDFSDEAARKKAVEAGLMEEKCHNYVRFVIEKLYQLDEKE